METQITFVKLLNSWYIDAHEFSHILSLSDCELVGRFDDFANNLTQERIVKLKASTHQTEEHNIILTYIGDQPSTDIGMYEVKIVNLDEVEYFSFIFLPPCIINIFGEYPKNIFLCH